MTDTYGTEPHDHDHGHDEILTHEHDAVREAPSDYEFSDEHSATVAEEQNEDHGVESEVKAGRRSAALPIAAAVGGVLLLGGVAWWQFGGGSSPAPVVVPSLSQTASLSPAPVQMPAPPPQTPDLPTTPTVAAASVAPTSAPTDTVPPPATAYARPAAPPPMGAFAPPPLAQMAPVAPPMPMPPAAPAATATADTADIRVDALNKRIEDLQKSLDQVTQQMAQVTNMVSASAGAPGSPSPKDVQDRLDKLEQQLAATRQGPAPHIASPKVLPGDTAIDTETTTHTSKVSVHHTAPKARVSHKTAPMSKPSATSWVLRAASPGQAWIASSSTSHDLKQVQIGDVLDGVGSVTAITQNNGKWVVLGTKGTIQ